MELDCKFYEAEAVDVKYFNPKKEINSSYLIDLRVRYADGSIKWIEIKPEKWLADSVNRAKIAAAEREAVEADVPFWIWTETTLFPGGEKEMREFVRWLRQHQKG